VFEFQFTSLLQRIFKTKMTKQHRSVYAASLIFIILCLCTKCSAYKELSTPGVLTNIIVDNATGNLYIGGSNFILKANTDLVVIKQNSTGPQPDNPLCVSPYPAQCKEKRVPTDNRNKILLIDISQQKLLTCGSVYHGGCELRDLNSLDKVQTSWLYVASARADPAIGFIAPGPLGSGRLGKVLYVGTTWFPKNVEDNSAPAVASLSLDSQNLFELAVDGARITKLKFSDVNYEVRYIHGFTSSDFSYFITVQESLASYNHRVPKNPSALKQYETKIVHVCQRDESYDSYTEIPLKCSSRNGTDFNVATSAFVTKAGAKLTKKLGVSSNSEVLFVTFSKSDAGSSDPSQNSVVCYYSMNEIKEGFKRNIEKCSKNEGLPLGMPWTTLGKGTCTRYKSQLYSGTCPSGTQNYPVGGGISVSSTAVLETNKSALVSISALAYEEYTVVFLGDSNGHLFKVGNNSFATLLLLRQRRKMFHKKTFKKSTIHAT
jgi:plexin A